MTGTAHIVAMDREISPPRRARDLIRAADRAVLSTSLADGGWPYGSLVMTACDHEARPLLLLSDLAEHSRNLAADSRASLLFDGTAGLDNPLAGARVSVLGRLSPVAEDAPTARYVARHPEAAAYLDFADFRMYRMEAERAHLVAGFGEIHWIPGEALLFEASGAEALAETEAGIVAHMNDDHRDAVGLYATRLLGHATGDWRMTGVDPEGIDLRKGAETARLAFSEPVRDAAAARGALVALAKRAREGREC